MRQPSFSCVLVAVVLSAIASSAHAQSDLPAVDTFGPQVGEQVPDFSLRDQDDQVRDLASIMGPNGAMLVFNRSAEW